ncbi:MAG: nucleotidyltransferase family protein [Acidobacteria bacterium]|nr:nucleotidyltransferase family protein [Acidobacteriota bacterium]
MRIADARALRELVAACGLGPVPVTVPVPGPVPVPVPVVTRELATLADTEGVAPLLGARLAAGELEADDAIRGPLVESHRRTALANTALALGTEALTRPLRGAGIPVLLLKGAALLRTVYGDPGRRSMGDVDLLVPPERWREALQVVRSTGAEAYDAPGRAVTLEHFHELHLRLPAGGVVDLHRGLVPHPLFAVDHDELLATAREEGDGLLVPAPNALFLSLALHAAKDGFFLPLRAVIDGLALLAGGRVEAEAAADLARRWQARRATARYLGILGRLGTLPAGWAALGRELAPRLPPAPGAYGLERPVDPMALGHRLRCRWRCARLQDGPLRPLTYNALWLQRFARDLLKSPGNRRASKRRGDES